MQKIILKIEGMHCPNCAMVLERLENTLPGIEKVDASYHKARMVVEFDEHIVSEEAIRNEILKLGYGIVS